MQKAGTPPAPAGQRDEGTEAILTIVGADYFDALRLPILRGRGFTPSKRSPRTVRRWPSSTSRRAASCSATRTLSASPCSSLTTRSAVKRSYTIVGVVSGRAP